MNGTHYGTADLSPFRFSKPTDAKPGEHHIYALAISSGVVKVGFAIYPQGRITSHVRTALIHGASITALWLSIPHGNAKDNEKSLIRYCRQRATGQLGFEYFTGVPLADVVEHAESLEYRRLPAPPGLPATYSLDEVAHRYGLSSEALHRMCRAGQVRHFSGGPTRLMADEHVEELIHSDHLAALTT